jgi:hypothetical protein
MASIIFPYIILNRAFDCGFGPRVELGQIFLKLPESSVDEGAECCDVQG